MNLELIDKTALISGSTKGIGFAIASQLAAEGARVIVNGRSENAVSSALEQVRNAVHKPKVEGFVGDLATTTATEDLHKLFPTVDILVNNLGIYEPKPFDKISDEDWRHVFEVNVLSGVRLSRAYISGMKQRNWGRIIFISSESGIFTPKEMIHYGMTKTAQLAVSRGLAEAVAGTGITVNSILPGRPNRAVWVNSSRHSPKPTARPSRLLRRSFSRRCGQRPSSRDSKRQQRLPPWSPTSPARCHPGRQGQRFASTAVVRKALSRRRNGQLAGERQGVDLPFADPPHTKNPAAAGFFFRVTALSDTRFPTKRALRGVPCPNRDGIGRARRNSAPPGHPRLRRSLRY